jgi:hypothetical protein
VGVSAQLDQPRWPTSHALLLGCQLPELQRFCQQAADYLLGVQGLTWPRRHDDVTGHDTNIPGWPWVDQTHSWVEPTAMAILALQKFGRASHPRVAQGKWMLLDRMIPSGGWNYGNSFVFQQELRPRPAPTGLALLALCGATGIELGPSLDYLERDLPGIRSPQSLCWGLLALKAWGRQIEGTEHWLEESFEQVDGYFDPALQLSYLLLAAAGRLHMFGIVPVKERTA